MKLSVIFTTAFMVSLSGTMMPGPLTAILLERAIKEGFRAGPLITLGHAVPEILAVALLAAGLGGCLAHPVLAGLTGVAGSLVLAWMGVALLRSAPAGPVNPEPSATEGVNKPPGGSFGAGIIGSLSNPYWFLWWATIGAGYTTLAREYGAAGVTAFFGGHILADLAWFSILALTATSGRHLITAPVYRVIMTLLGTFLIAFALYFARSGLKFWL